MKIYKDKFRDDFIAKSVKQRKIKKFIHDSVKDDPSIKEAKAKERQLIRELKAQGKEYHNDSREWY